MLDLIQQGIKDAMRAQAKLRLSVLRSLLNDLKNAGIDKKGAQGLTAEVASPAEYLDEQEMQRVVRGAAKRRRESAEQYRAGNRADLAEQEEAELVILEEFLPRALSEAEVVALVDAAVVESGASAMSEMGMVMKIVTERAAGRADGKALSAAVRARLA